MPERFLDATGQLDLSKGDPAEFTFGFGRRCVADVSLTHAFTW